MSLGNGVERIATYVSGSCAECQFLDDVRYHSAGIPPVANILVAIWLGSSGDGCEYAVFNLVLEELWARLDLGREEKCPFGNVRR
jgi:hypothetical protein